MDEKLQILNNTGCGQFRLIILICSLLLISEISKSQEFATVDSIVEHYPRSFRSIEKLSDRICTDFSNPAERARAVYAWIGNNVRYDVKAYYLKKKGKHITYKSREERIRKENKLQNRIAENTFRKKKAVCYGYALLFQKICDLCEIQCVVIAGGDRTKKGQIGKNPSRRAHAWNAVNIDRTWHLIDVTWGAGTVDTKTKEFIPGYTDLYFFMPAASFFLNHFPKDTSWVLLDRTKSDFVKQPLYYGDYIKSGIYIVNPPEGVINMDEHDTINFRITNIPQSLPVSYTFSNDKFRHMIVPKLRNTSYCEFDIVNPLRNNGYLTLFDKDEAIVTYKIVVSK